MESFVVTGARSGIGRAVAERLATPDAAVVAVAVDVSALAWIDDCPIAD